MKILLFVDNFHPETNAPASRSYEHSRHWANLGHKVTVITSSPNFPEGVIHSGYDNRWRSVEYIEGIKVVRVKTFIAKNDGFTFRILDFLSYMFVSFLMSWFEPKPDKVVASSPQFFTLISGCLYAQLRRVEFTIEIRDFWPGAVDQLTNIPVFLLKPVYFLEKFLYAKANKIIVVTNGFKRELVERGFEKSKIFVVHNGVDLTKFKPKPKSSVLIDTLNIRNKFVVGYLGTHGVSQDLSRLLLAAENLQANPKITFLFVGNGAEKEKLTEQARIKGLSNVQFINSVPKDEVVEYLTLFDLSFVGLKNLEFFHNVIPSKIFECFSVAVPILASLPTGDASSIIDTSRAGILCDINDDVSIERNILLAFEGHYDLLELSENCKEAARTFNRTSLAERMLGYLER